LLRTGDARQARLAEGENAKKRGTMLIEQVVQRDNLLRAHQRVVQNKGAPGADGIRVDQLMDYCRQHWSRIRQELLSGRYVPLPVKRVDIPKPDGKGTRMLGIPPAIDRLIQQALLQVLQPLFEPLFSPYSFGFRPKRNAHQAVSQARDYVAAGCRYVVDIDLEKFFDRVNHDILMSRVARVVKDKLVLRLIRSYLEAGMLVGGVVEARFEGTPQGGPLSPLLSNVLLTDLDNELTRRGLRFCRYADDCNIYVGSQAAGERVLSSVRLFLETKLKLKVNAEKSAVAHPWERKFLGYSMTRHPKLKVAPQSVERLKQKLRPYFREARGIPFTLTLQRIGLIVGGWTAYYKLSECMWTFEVLDKWLRRHLRAIIWRQWKQPRTRIKELVRRGVRLEEARAVASSRGPWFSASLPQMHKAFNNKVLRELGYTSLLEGIKRFGQSG